MPAGVSQAAISITEDESRHDACAYYYSYIDNILLNTSKRWSR